jgi:hypothetical protein
VTNERNRAEFLKGREAIHADINAAIDHVMTGDLYPADRRVRLRQLRRQTLLPLIVAWAATIAGIVVSHFTLAPVPVLAVLPLLGAGTFNFITGWPIRRR